MLGLALSGGGFRASFYHIGVLARMADLDLLRHVEVISTVSGGSIIGALYYLKLKKLLESKAGREITAEDYQRLVASLIESFKAAVQQNLRMRTFTNPAKNLRMSRANYSRSDRIGELFDQYLYRPVLGGDGPVLMRDLLIQPPDAVTAFKPDRHNVERSAKVPILLINATSLNTGRNWRFEAIRMGEPPPQGRLAKDLDKRLRLQRPDSYADTTPAQADIELGHAVAASAAVPGIFHPLAISRMYPDTRVELVDGGVHDNQGVQALIDRGCTQFIISDGSGQMEGLRHPATSIPSVLMRSSSISMSRVREEQVLRAGDKAGEGGLCLVHLRKGLAPEYIPYIDAGKSVAALFDTTQSVTLERYGIAPEVQEALSKIRTDLDAFSDMEADSLMLSGYRMAGHELQRQSGLWGRKGKTSEWSWSFLNVADLAKEPTPHYMRVLDVGSSVAFKVFGLYPRLATAFLTVAAVIAGFLLWHFRGRLGEPIVPISLVPSRLTLLLVVFALVPIVNIRIRSILMRFMLVRKIADYTRVPWRWTMRMLFRALPLAAGAIVFSLYLWFANPLYLKAGRIPPPDPKTPPAEREQFTKAS